VLDVLVQVFCLSQILGRIFSFTDSKDDLLNLRLVKHLFQEEATKLLSHGPIKLENEASVTELVRCLKTRQILNLNPETFTSAFEVYLDSNMEVLESFAGTVGPHIDRFIWKSDL